MASGVAPSSGHGNIDEEDAGKTGGMDAPAIDDTEILAEW